MAVPVGVGGGEEELPLNDGSTLIQHLVLDTRHIVRGVGPPDIYLWVRQQLTLSLCTILSSITLLRKTLNKILFKRFSDCTVTIFSEISMTKKTEQIYRGKLCGSAGMS